MKANSPRVGMLLPNRFVLIVITVTMVTGGFLLGYFVGKSTSSPQISSVQLHTPQPVSSPAAHDKAPVSNTEPPQGISQSADSPVAKQQMSSDQNSAEQKEIPQNSSKIQTASQKEASFIPKQTSTPDETGDASRRKAPFSVQAGAFQRENEAENLKLKLKVKGYSASIINDINSSGSPLFKVRIGDFETKKEAEVFALKVKKTEGLQAIVIRKK